MKKIAFEWTDESVKLLRDLWNAGVPARDIAIKFGNNVTRNAVIGKANRMGLSSAKTTKTKNPKKDNSLTYPEDDRCQWPSGHPDEDDFAFCNEAVETAKPYCQNHCSEAYRRIAPTITAN